MPYSTDDIRNIPLVGHASSGKTALFEAVLQAGGIIQTVGLVERGSTVSDFDPMEKERKHSLYTTLASTDYRSCHINLIDNALTTTEVIKHEQEKTIRFRSLSALFLGNIRRR